MHPFSCVQLLGCTSGRRRAPPSLSYKSYKSYKSYASATPTQHAHHRCHKKSPAHPIGKSAPKPNHTAAQQAHGLSRGAPIMSDKSDKSDKSDTSATPPHPAYRRCHKKSLAYPGGKSLPEPFQTATQQALGVYSGAPLPVSYR